MSRKECENYFKSQENWSWENSKRPRAIYSIKETPLRSVFTSGSSYYWSELRLRTKTSLRAVRFQNRLPGREVDFKKEAGSVFVLCSPQNGFILSHPQRDWPCVRPINYSQNPMAFRDSAKSLNTSLFCFQEILSVPTLSIC